MLHVIILVFVCAVGPIASQSIKNSTFEAFKVCDSNSVRMYMWRNYGENYWNGSVEFRYWPELREIYLVLTLDAPATEIEVWKSERHKVRPIHRGGNQTFSILSVPSNESADKVFFTVHFDPMSFPNVKRLKVFHVDVCDDPVQTTSLGDGFYRASDLKQLKIRQCGRRVIEHRQLITNGFAAREGDWPWHSAVYHTDDLVQSYKCGGTLITSSAVLTAAHCLYDLDHPIIASRVVVHVGKISLTLAGMNTQQFQAYRIFVHHDYKPERLLDDIGLIRLTSEATFTAYVKPICLWDEKRPALSEVVNKNGIVVGWGFNEHDAVSKLLGEANMPVVSVIECLKSNPDFFGSLLTEKTYCAGFRNGTSTCNGDSGGGMYFEEDGVYRLRGIVSIAKSRSGTDNFCDPNSYVVFSDVAQYLDWIREKLED